MAFWDHWRILRKSTPKLVMEPGETDSLFRRFLYLDFDMVINALAFVEGGVVEEVLDKTVSEFGGEGKVTAKNMLFAGLDISGKTSRQLDREIKLKRTGQAAVGILIGRLRKAGNLRRFRPAGPRDRQVYGAN
jgi:hypothetical protein